MSTAALLTVSENSGVSADLNVSYMVEFRNRL